VWHSEACGDDAVGPAVYNSAFQQDAVVVGQVTEEGAKPIRGNMHRADLGGQDDTPGQTGFPGTFLALRTVSGPRHTWECVQAQGREPRKYQSGASSWPRCPLPGGMGIPWTPIRQG
jgi:hypothetical protein